MMLKVERFLLARTILLLGWLGGVLGTMLIPAAHVAHAQRLGIASSPAFSSSYLLVSLANSQNINGIAAANEDILEFDGESWSLFFDGSDVGVSRRDLVALALLDVDSLLLVFNSPVTLSGIAVQPQDIVRFDAGSLGETTSGVFSLYFDGSDAGLTTPDESIDAVSVLSNGRLLISTFGDPVVKGVSGADEDILMFTPSLLGDITRGTWSIYFDGSDVGLANTVGEDLDALDVASDGRLYLSTLGSFSVRGVKGRKEDVFACTPVSTGRTTTCQYATALYFDGHLWGLGHNDVDALHFSEALDTPTPSRTVSPTFTPTHPSLTATPTLPSSTATCSPVHPNPTSTFTSTQPNSTATFTPTKNSHSTTSTPEQPGSMPTFTPSPTDRVPTSAGMATYISLPASLDHEQGDFSQYSYTDTDGNDLSISTEAGLAGTKHGLSVLVDDSHRAYACAALETPSTTGVVRARFYVDPNSLRMSDLSQVSFLYLINAGRMDNFALMKLMKINGRYFLRGVMVDDNGTHRETEAWSIADASHVVEIQIRRAANASSSDATYETWIDGVYKTIMTGVDSYEKFANFQYLSVGLNGIAGNVSGTYYVDEIMVNDDGNEIGFVPEAVLFTILTPQPIGTPSLRAPIKLSPTAVP